MWMVDILFALGVALLLAAVVRSINRRHGDPDAPAWPNLAFLVVVLFFITWAGGIWLRPLGPILWRVYWIPFVAVGVVAALLLVAATPRRHPRNRREALEARAQERVLETAFGVFFWILVTVLLTAVTVRYFV